MKKVLSDMQLRGFWIEHVRISKNNDYKDDQPTSFKPKLGIDFSTEKYEGEWRFYIVLDFKIRWHKSCNFDYDEIALKMSGDFIFPSETKEEEIKRYVPHVCLANLWGIARGIVLQVTGLFPGGKILLPTVNMVEIVDNYIHNQEKRDRSRSIKKSKS